MPYELNDKQREALARGAGALGDRAAVRAVEAAIVNVLSGTWEALEQRALFGGYGMEGAWLDPPRLAPDLPWRVEIGGLTAEALLADRPRRPWIGVVLRPEKNLAKAQRVRLVAALAPLAGGALSLLTDEKQAAKGDVRALWRPLVELGPDAILAGAADALLAGLLVSLAEEHREVLQAFAAPAPRPAKVRAASAARAAPPPAPAPERRDDAPLPDDPTEAVRLLLEPLVRPSLRLAVTGRAPGEGALLATRFGGDPYAEAGEDWPTCPRCGTGLDFVGQLDATGLEGGALHALYTFFCCWTCLPWGLEDDPPGTWVVRGYPVPAAHRAVILDNPGDQGHETPALGVSTTPAPSLPSWDGAERFAPRLVDVATRDLDVIYDRVCRELVGRPHEGSAMGGYPRWIQADATPRCRACGRHGVLLAQLASLPDHGLVWGDLGTAWLFACTEHPGEVELVVQCG